MTFRVAGAARTAIGARSSQEDAFAIWTPPSEANDGGSRQLLAVVADGMGGHVGGEVASRLACDGFVAAFADGDGAVSERLNAALDDANVAIARRIADAPKLRGMGSTLVAAFLDETGLRWASVGDSALLLFRAPGDGMRLNADHSLGAFLDARVRNNSITPAEAARNPHRNALRSALGGKRIEIRDLGAEPYPLKSGDWLIVASDGIATLSGDEIGDIVYADPEAGPDDVAARLIAAVLAKDEPAQDNTTIVALKIEGDTLPIAEDERPTRIIRAVGETTADDDIARATPRFATTTVHASMLNGYACITLAAGFAGMFLIGWLVRAWLD